MSSASGAHQSASHRQTVFHLQQAFKLALSLTLFYWLALWTNWDLASYGALAIVIVSLGTTGASIETGIMRVVGTTTGLAVGFLMIGLFSHDRWLTLGAFAIYITGIGYGMQTSRHRYAWYAAGFIPLVVWADNYPQFSNVFHFGTFRWIETTAGILIYTVVDFVVWPRYAGPELERLGEKLWADIRARFDDSRRTLDQDSEAATASVPELDLAGTLSRTISTLQQAFLDTPSVGNQKRVWKIWCLQARALVEAVSIWQEGIVECQQLDIHQLVPGLAVALDTLDGRLARIASLWGDNGDSDQDADDGRLSESLALDVSPPDVSGISPADRAALMSFLGHLKLLDRVSGELLQTMRFLAHKRPVRAPKSSRELKLAFQPSNWDPQRLLKALFPTAAFTAAFLFWIAIDPPAGPKVAMMTGVFSLLILRTPMKPMPLWLSMVVSSLVAVAPVYWLVMPALNSGYELLALVFVYAFVFGFLGGRSPVLKSGPIIQFVMSVGISNHQSYSFQGLIDGALMTSMAGMIVAVVYYFFLPMRPEQNLVRSVRRFFRGCGGVARSFAYSGPVQEAKGRRLRKRYLESMVLPVPATIMAAEQQLDYAHCPANNPEKVRRLHDSLQCVANRLEAFTIAHSRMLRHENSVPEPVARVGAQLRDALQRVFERWARLDSTNTIHSQHDILKHLSRDMRQQMNTHENDRALRPVSDSALIDFYTVLGNARGLIHAMENMQIVMAQINWSQWASTRF